jgi:hypothetical protein
MNTSGYWSFALLFIHSAFGTLDVGEDPMGIRFGRQLWKAQEHANRRR